jgi:hypothetical protein
VLFARKSTHGLTPGPQNPKLDPQNRQDRWIRSSLPGFASDPIRERGNLGRWRRGPEAGSQADVEAKPRESRARHGPLGRLETGEGGDVGHGDLPGHSRLDRLDSA